MLGVDDINKLQSDNKRLNDIIDSYQPRLEELKGLKVENKRLKECNEELTSDNLNTIQEMDNERRRVEQLKEENETLKITREKLLGDLYITEESLKDYEEHYNRSEQEKERYYQTLQEIKEIAEKVMLTELCNSCDGCGLIYGCNDTDCAYYQMEKILQKITKTEE